MLSRIHHTVLHGVCLLDGKHPAGSQLAKECPVLNASKRSEARKKGWLTRRGSEGQSDQQGRKEG